MADFNAIVTMSNTLKDMGIKFGEDDSYGLLNERKNGHHFSFEEHVEAMVLSLLSANRPWAQIAVNKENLRIIFHGYNPTYICETDPQVFIDAIKRIGCGNRAIVRQMQSLAYNVELFQRINEIIGDIDNLAANNDPYKVACILSDGYYKVKGFAMALALQYLRNVGVDTFKPDVHIRRILVRLGFTPWEDCTVREISDVMNKLSRQLSMPVTYVNEVIWCYGATGYGEICAKEPKCRMCKVEECPYRKSKYVG